MSKDSFIEIVQEAKKAMKEKQLTPEENREFAEEFIKSILGLVSY